MELDDLQSGVSETSAQRVKLGKEKKALELQIKEKEAQLVSLAPEFTALLAKETTAKEK